MIIFATDVKCLTPIDYYIKGEETEANSGLGDGVHGELLGVIDDLHINNHKILELGSQRMVNAGYPPNQMFESSNQKPE